jgi:hypothetical protein
MIRRTYGTNNEQALLKFGDPHRYLTSGSPFTGMKCPRSAYDASNEDALLKFNGPYLPQTSEPSFTVVKYPQVIQTTKVIKYGNVKIYGIPQKVNNVKEEEAQWE